MTRLASSELASVLDDLLTTPRPAPSGTTTRSIRADQLRAAIPTTDPDLSPLARFLHHCNSSFSDLERRIAARQGAPFRRPRLHIDPRLVVARLDLALRCLRLERTVRIPELQKAVPTITADTLRSFETSSLEPQLPTLSQLDDLLDALGATYRDLEERAANPLQPLVASANRTRRARPRPRLAAQRRVLSPLASERFDLALRSLRAERGISSARLAALAGLTTNRLLALENPDRSESPTEHELTLLLVALDIDVASFEHAARYPLHVLDAAKRRWEQEEDTKLDVRIAGERVPRRVLERTDLALRSLRRRRSLSRAALSERTGLSAARLADLENPSSDAFPTSEELERLLLALAVTFEDFEAAALSPLSLASKHRRSSAPPVGPLDAETHPLLPHANAVQRALSLFAARLAPQSSSEEP